MLSFLREQGFEQASVNGTGKSTDAPGDKEQEQQYLTVSAKGKNVRKMTMMLAVLFVIGLMSLMFMIKKSAPRQANAASETDEQSQIEKAICFPSGDQWGVNTSVQAGKLVMIFFVPVCLSRIARLERDPW